MSRSKSRQGITRINVAALLVVGFLVFYAASVGILTWWERDRANQCKDRLRQLGAALNGYEQSNGHYPGYMNVLQRDDGTVYIDPESKEVAPVSWAVMILPYLEHRPLFDEWRKSANPQAPNTAVDVFVCPSDVTGAPQGPHLSYVVNTGMPDAPLALPAEGQRIGIPRDWAAGGVFFDNFSEHELVKQASPRGPMEIMSRARIKDGHAQTILLTENVDATEYVIRTRKHAADHWKKVEVQMGCTWQVGPVDYKSTPPTMIPPIASLHSNVDAGKGDGTKYDYCRPSSRHPGTVHVCWAGLYVGSWKDTISYFIFARLMGSDDDNLKEVGGTKLLDPALRQYSLFQQGPDTQEPVDP